MRKISAGIFMVVLSVFVTMTAYAGTWQKDTYGWKYKNDDGTYSKFSWQWIDNKCYCFGSDGYMYENTTTPDGYSVNKNGAWTVNGTEQLRNSSGGDYYRYYNQYVAQSLTENAKSQIKSFMQSFDWERSDELTKARKVFERIACNQNGNTYGTVGNLPLGSLSVLEYKKGLCQDYAQEYALLAHCIGMNAETYSPEVMHEAVLINISGEWWTVDPTKSNNFSDTSYNHKVDDYQEEKISGADAFWNSTSGQQETSANELSERLTNGQISSDEFCEKMGALYGWDDATIQRNKALYKK